MADKFLQLDNNKYVIQSSEIKVFPSSYRGTNDNTFINLESKLSTEYSLRHLSPSFTKNSYILSWEGNKLCCVIAGYYFEINVSKTDDIPAGYTKVAIKLGEVPLAAGSTTDTTMILTSWKETTNSNDQSTVVDKQLDFKDDTQNEYYFSGLVFVNTIPSECFGLDLSDDVSIQNTHLVIDSSQVESKVQNVEIAGSLYNGTATGAVRGGNESNTTASGLYSSAIGDDVSASGNYSHAIGKGLKASAQSQCVFGQYNIEDNTNTNNTFAEIVGWGSDDTHLKNIRTLDRSGNEVLAGIIDTKGATINGITEINNTDDSKNNNVTIGYSGSNGAGKSNSISISGGNLFNANSGVFINSGANDSGKTEIGKAGPVSINGSSVKININGGSTTIGNGSNTSTINGYTVEISGGSSGAGVKINNTTNVGQTIIGNDTDGITKILGTVTLGKNNASLTNSIYVYGGKTVSGSATGGVNINTSSSTGQTEIGNSTGKLILKGSTVSANGINIGNGNIPYYTRINSSETLQVNGIKVVVCTQAQAPSTFANDTIYYITEN